MEVLPGTLGGHPGALPTLRSCGWPGASRGHCAWSSGACAPGVPGGVESRLEVGGCVALSVLRDERPAILPPEPAHTAQLRVRAGSGSGLQRSRFSLPRLNLKAPRPAQDRARPVLRFQTWDNAPRCEGAHGHLLSPPPLPSLEAPGQPF